MRLSSRGRGAKAKPKEDKNEVLERLKEISTSIGLEVREVKLLREAGYSVRGGLCTLDGRDIVMLDKNVDAESRIDTLCSVLSKRDLDAVFIEPELREMISGSALLADEVETGRP